MYATVEQANAYIQSYYSSTSPLRMAWNALSDEDKQVALNRSQQQIDLLPLKGRPLGAESFPREPFKDRSLEAAKIATIELAIQGFDETARERFTLQKQGVQSYRIGDLSETFKGGSSAAADNGGDPFVLSIVFPFLKDWLGGGYRIEPEHHRERRDLWRIRTWL